MTDRKTLEIKDLLLDNKKKIIDVFSWLIKEDKKQNPELYKLTEKPL